MSDSYTFGKSLSNHSSEKEDHIFLNKDLQYIVDSNSRNYTRNEVTFDSVTLSNNGRFTDYSEAFLSIPVVIQLERTVGGGATPLSTAQALDQIRMKNNLALIDSVSVTYNNQTVVQESSEIASHLCFKQHTTMSLDDQVKSDVFGHVKDSHAWSYSDSAGLMNSDSASASADRLKRPWETEINGDVMPFEKIKKSGADCYEAGGANNHIFYYDCRIMLKDLSSVFEKLPLVKGASIRISVRLNQGSVSVATDAQGVASVVPNLKGSAFPVMRLSLPVNETTDIISVAVAKLGAYEHQKKECRMYVPVYELAGSFESQYLSQSSKKVVYDDVYINHVRNIGQGAFSSMLTNSIARSKRLIVVPMLSRATNGGSLPTESPFCTAPATVSPNFCKMNVKVSGRNVYPANVEYKYEHFMNEIGMETAEKEGLLSLKDHQNVFGYFVVDLSRRHAEDDMTPLSLELFGSVESPLPLDFLCITEFEKDITVDVATGQLLSV